MVGGSTDSDPALVTAPDDPRSRRQLLVGGGVAALGAAGVLGGCGMAAQKSSVALTKHSPGAKNDVRILNRLLDLEYKAIYAYTASIPLLAAANRQNKTPHKKKPSQPVSPATAKKKAQAPLSTAALLASNAAAQFLSQEIDHTLELKGYIKQAGGKPHRSAPAYDLGASPTSRKDVLLILHALEQAQLVAYLEAARTLTPGQLRASAAAIFANEAQHLMVLRMELGLTAIPSPFVSGRE